MGMDWKDDNDLIIEILPLKGSKSDPRNYVFAKEQISMFWDHIVDMFTSAEGKKNLSSYVRCRFMLDFYHSS